jgi:hypothetical protein
MMRSHSDGVTPSAAMPNFMADRGARLVDAGYSILPIAPGAKCPGQYSNSNLSSPHRQLAMSWW